MGLDKQKVIEFLTALPPEQMQEVILELEERLGIERLVVAPQWGWELVGESMGIPSFDVHLEACGDDRIAVMKALRSWLGLGLRETKALVDQCPVRVAEDVGREAAVGLSEVLKAAGARVKVR